MHVKNPLRALYKNYVLFTIHFKVRIIELFWLVNFGNTIQSEHSLHILSEMIWFIDRPILLAPYFLIVQSEELLLLKPVIFTKNSMVHDLAWLFLCTSKWRVRGYIAPPKNLDVPPKMMVKGYMYPQMKKTCGHADIKLNIMQVREDTSVLLFPILYFLRKKLGSYGV